jgi:glutamate synthase (NADPH/NADH) small chain
MLPKPDPKSVDRKTRMQLPSNGVPKQPPEQRRANFEETYLPLDPESAMHEAARCIQCPGAVCVKACPVHNDIPLALWQIEHGQFEDAAAVFRRTSTMPEICGRVCPQVLLCEGACIYNKKGLPPVPVGRLEAFAADYERNHGGLLLERDAPTGHRAAIVGAGPAGLTAAMILARRGHDVTVFDCWPASGGILRYGIPRFKMAHAVVDDLTDYVSALGVEFEYCTTIGRDRSVDELLGQGYEAVFLGVGAGVGAVFDIPGAGLSGVYSATPFLIQANVPDDQKPSELKGVPEIGPRVAVIGGGDTAMDCVRTAVRLGAERVLCVYRRTEAEMPGNVRDRAFAREEGVEFHWLTQPVRIIGDEHERVRAMQCIRMELGEPDASGRRRPVPIPGTEFAIDIDTVVSALGYWPDPLIGEATPGLGTHEWGLIDTDEATGATTRDGVFAGGDDVLGPKLVVTAVAQALTAAEAMHEYLMEKGSASERRRSPSSSMH